jgi:hypothetical protein
VSSGDAACDGRKITEFVAVPVRSIRSDAVSENASIAGVFIGRDSRRRPFRRNARTVSWPPRLTNLTESEMSRDNRRHSVRRIAIADIEFWPRRIPNDGRSFFDALRAITKYHVETERSSGRPLI